MALEAPKTRVQTIWKTHLVSSCPRCGTMIAEFEMDFCYPVTRNYSTWSAGCPCCNLYIEGDSVEKAIENWNNIDHQYIQNFSLIEDEFVQEFKSKYGDLS